MTTQNGNLYRNFNTPGYDNTATIFPEQLFQDYIGLVSTKELETSASGMQEHIKEVKALVASAQVDCNISTMKFKNSPKDIEPTFTQERSQNADIMWAWGIADMALCFNKWVNIICEEAPPSRVGRFDTPDRCWLSPKEDRMNDRLILSEYGAGITETVKAFVHPVRPITAPIVLMVDDMSEPP